MVEHDFRALIDAFDSNEKVSFFAVLKMDDYTDKWSLLFSGPSLAMTKKKEELFHIIVPEVNKYITKNNANDIARIGILPLSNHLVKELKKYTSDTKLEKRRVNGNFVHEGFIFINRNTRRPYAQPLPNILKPHNS